MKKIALATAFTLAASTAFAGGFDDPVVEPVVVEEEATTSAGGILIPLLFVALVALAAS
ncbi:hypothetical protein [Litoreibacter roseus]|uniref:Ferrochelatase n=1 Tax=Litoreibacter roseus TaxID=2601869 RepID=A0A6N6JEA9_9RHOB|nr:hypothetical protein [Litoreibacter roseus]GFE64465.1 hypothetical protein KIN_15390 [Litoreibacter roseus]